MPDLNFLLPVFNSLIKELQKCKCSRVRVHTSYTQSSLCKHQQIGVSECGPSWSDAEAPQLVFDVR